MPVTIYDVAKKAGVGIGTVSRALNNAPHIAPKTKTHVLRTIKELSYNPHALAQGLARKKTNSVAVIVPFFMTYFFVEMLKGIQHELTVQNYNLILYSIDKKDKLNLFLKRTLAEKRVDGVVLCSLEIDEKYARRFLNSSLPIVLLDSYHDLLDSITIENELGAYVATRQLIQDGHRKIGLINAQLVSAPAKLRLKGFQRAMREEKLEPDDRYIIYARRDDDSDGFSRAAGYEAMHRLLTCGNDHPTAVFIASDIQAIGAIQAMKERNLRVPEDISIVSFDDIELAELFGLTTMRQPIYRMGQIAIKRLIEKISGSANNSFHRQIEPELILRQSCCHILN